jgi:beta-lactamase regulating signal transducer with metallopeptidase domain
MTPLLVYILKVALLTAVFVLLYHLLLRRDTFHRTARIVLVSSLVISYILPFCVITIHKPIILAENPEVEVAQTPVAVPAAQDNYQAQPGLQQSQFQMQPQPQQQALTTAYSNHRQIDWIAIAAVIYALGVVILIALRLLSVQKVLRIIRRGRVILKRDGCRIVISGDDIRPFSWMNSIVLPENMAQSESLWNSAVVRHEHSHVSHHHSIELLATDILSAFQWFNPAVWLLRHDLCCVQEFQADASVLDSGLDKLEYEQSLLSIATGGLSIPLVNGLGESYLRTRIRMMNRNHSRKGSLLKLIYLPIVLIVALVFMSNTVYDIAVNASSDPVNDVPAIEEPVTSADDILVVESENEDTPAYNEPAETDIEESMDADDPETSRTLLARYDESLLPTQVEIQSYPDYKELPQNLPSITLDSNNKQYPELNSLESIYDDGIITNDKPYKGYISCIQLSKGVYSFWVMGLEGKGGQVVSIELGTMDEAIAFLKNLISSYKQGNTVHAQGHTLTGVRGNAYSVPRTDGVEPGPYLVSVKNLKHDLSVLEKRKNWGTANYDEIAFFTMENKPDHYEVLNPLSPTTYEYLETNTWEGVDGGEEWARTELEKQIREHGGEGHVPGKSEWARSRFNGVILLPLQKSEYMKQSGAYREYVQFYIPIIYDPEKYQAPLTDYQRSLKRSVFRRDSKKDKTVKDASYNEVGFFTMENKPDEYEVLFHDSRPAEMTLTEREDGGSGESWAATEIEKKIRDLASLGIHKDMANTRFNGVILVGELYRGYDLVFGTWYRQYYIPINYDQEKYQAPLTEYQKGLKQRKK